MLLVSAAAWKVVVDVVPVVTTKNVLQWYATGKISDWELLEGNQWDETNSFSWFSIDNHALKQSIEKYYFN